MAGERKGTPGVAGNFYLGFELPLATSHVEAQSISFTLQRALPLQRNRTLTYSAVAGVAAPKPRGSASTPRSRTVVDSQSSSWV